MKSYLMIAILACGLVMGLAALQVKAFDYDRAWKEIEKLDSDRLPKSMAEKVDLLYQTAVTEQKTDQQIKALIYQLKIQQSVEEFSAQKVILKVQENLLTAPFPASAILHSMLAELYWSYYEDNRWSYSDRTEIVSFRADDIATWDLKTISKETIRQYRLSLNQAAELQKHLIADYPAFLDEGGKEERLLRPTLYDFLAHRALEFYINDESGLTLPPEEFAIADTLYFQPMEGFAEMVITSPDSLSLKYQAALLYQDLIRFHLFDQDVSALMEVNLDRLEFFYDNARLPNPEKHYEAALRLEMLQYAANPVSALAAYKLASLYNTLAGKYNPELSEDYRWHFKIAAEICDHAEKAFPRSIGGQYCATLSSQIKHPVLQITSEQYVQPNMPIKVLLGLKNLGGTVIKIYRIPYSSGPDDYNPDYSWQMDNYKKVRELSRKKPLWSQSFSFENEGDFRNHSFELALTSLPMGNYIIIGSNGMDDSTAIMGYSIFSSTNLSYVTPSRSDGSVMILNRSSGLPIKDAQLRLFYREWERKKDAYTHKQVWSGTSDAEGKIKVPTDLNQNSGKVLITSGADTLQIFNHYFYDYGDRRYKTTRCLLFTDRSIYRPGQTIHVKGLLYESDGEKIYNLMPNTSVTVYFYDSNYQLVASQNLKTNEYATFNAVFTAPMGVLTGNMRIQTSWGSVYFSVEEYKRPRFEVKIDPPKQTYKLGQNVSVKGTALSYAGFPIDNAELTYRISRQAKYPFWYWWWGPSPSVPEKEIVHGTAVTDANGEFFLNFIAEGDLSVISSYNPYFVFNISVDVTDIGGETRSGYYSLSIGEKELILNPAISANVDLEDERLSIPIRTTNLGGEKVHAKGLISISRLQSPDHVQKDRLWKAPDRENLPREEFLKLFPHDIFGIEDRINIWKVDKRVFIGNFNTSKADSLLIPDFADWAPGAYVLEAVSVYNQKMVREIRYFTVIDSASDSIPYPKPMWVIPLRSVCEPGEIAKVLFGSGYTDVSVLYEIEKNRVIVHSERILLSNSQRRFEIPVNEEDRGSFYVHFTFARDGRLYTHSQEITVPWTNKQISFEYMSFRDKLLPGQQEEWRIKLKDHSGGKVSAEVLASMYDASLDAFRDSKWSADVYGRIPQTGGWFNSSFVRSIYLNIFQRPGLAGYIPQRDFDSFNWFGYYISDYGYSYKMMPMAMSDRSIEMDAMSPFVAETTTGTAQSGVINIGGELNIRGGRANEVNMSIDGMSISEPVVEQDLSGVQARANFAETAFFYPELRTDENGEISFVFTVPEALTRWNFRALALSKDFKIGTTTNGTVTQKPLMVVPNAPRFFREGDRITFSTKIVALEDNDQSGSCQLYLFDAITMAPVDKLFALSKAQQSFSVKKGGSTVLSWDLSVPEGIGAVTYRVVAKAGDFSDGEENTLPVLSNRMLVTETLPLPVSGNSSKSFVFEKLRDSGASTTIRHHKLSLEYTSNPAWYAVQALPYLMEYPHDCNEQIFSRFYANSLASHIANANPRIKRVFESWRDTPNSAALLSNLEKNQELKSVILQETPWVLDAKNETQSKQRIGLLFDLNHMANQHDSTLAKLQRNQSPSGGWPWFPGMQDSWWVTQYIVEGLGHLDHLGVSSISKDARILDMTQNAVAYIDRKIREDYEAIKRYGNLERDNLGYMEMHYLYARSFFPQLPIKMESREAVDYFTAQAKQYWNVKDNFGQGLIALALHRGKDETTPTSIIASLRERALHNEELGMWWKGFERGWFWYQAPIETQALMIEAFHDIADNTAAIDEMRTWLLKQKQTTNWKTTKATAAACYALLMSGSEWLDSTELAQITIGGTKLDPMKLEGTKVEAGTGYFKTSWSGGEISPSMANVSVVNPNRVSSWGSLYWQYFEDLDRITPAETPLRLSKALFIERITDTGKVLDPVSDKTPLLLGDKLIVRIELRSDRDMEYVHMKDMRGAGLEPINVLSQSKWQDGLYYYEATGDAATNFFIEYLPKGTYVFEYPLRVNNKGDFSNGITSIQCMYAPEFSAHSEGIRILVK